MKNTFKKSTFWVVSYVWNRIVGKVQIHSIDMCRQQKSTCTIFELGNNSFSLY